MAFQIKSTAFEHGGNIPKKYTCDGADISPPLSWTSPPEATKSLALICDDPDAPVSTWVHWVAFNIPADKRMLHKDVPKNNELPDGTLQGKNSWGKIGYNGPMPPPGKPHRYFFKIYALDAVLDISSGATKQELLNAMEGHILAEAQLMGLYKR